MVKYVEKERSGEIELVGLEKQYAYVKEWLKFWSPNNVRKGIVLYGPPGCGKTSMVYKIAHDLTRETGQKWEVVEYNTSMDRSRSFMEELHAKVRMKRWGLRDPNTKIIILLDEADGIEAKSLLIDIIRDTQHPIILTCNDVSKLRKIRKGRTRLEDLCDFIYVPQPDQKLLIQHLQKRLREEGIDPKLIQGTRYVDHRQVELVFAGHGYDHSDTPFDLVKRWLNTGKFPSWYNRYAAWIILDSLQENLKDNVQILHMITKLALCDQARTFKLLEGTKIVNPKLTIITAKKIRELKEKLGEQLAIDVDAEERSLMGREQETLTEEGVPATETTEEEE